MRLRIVLLSAAVAVAIHPGTARAVCTGGSVGGFTQYLSGQIPDVIFISGISSKKNITPYYVSFPGTGGHCGIFARSTVPGTSVTDTYGCSGTACVTHPAGEFAAVGSAYPVAFNAIAPNRAGGTANYIPLAFDGSAPPGTQGFLELAYAANDIGDLSTAFIFARVPIYIESSTPASGWGLVISSSSNINGSRVVLAHPYLDGKPAARLFVSHVYNPGGVSRGINWNHHLVVEYDTGLERWTIRNADNTPMIPGLGFNFRVDPTAAQLCMPPPQTGNEFSTTLVIDDYNARSNPWATLIVAPVSGPDHPVAVRYTAPNWGIVYADGSVIPGGSCFNVKVIAFSQYINDPAQPDLSGKLNTLANNGVGVDMGASGANHVINGMRMFPFSWATRTGLRMIHTSNLTATSPVTSAAAYSHNSSLWLSQSCITVVCAYPPNRWALRYDDQTAIPAFLRINLWAKYSSCWARLSDMRVVWDRRNELRNRRTAGISFEQAKATFSDANATVIGDPVESENEERFVLLARSSISSVPLVVNLSCNLNTTIRIMSARRATRAERSIYEERQRR